jgi:hypothetical protein
MAGLFKNIYSFKQKWLEMFRDSNTKATELEDIQFGNDCKSLGFEIDCGHAFVSMYGKAWDHNKKLKQIIDDITDCH